MFRLIEIKNYDTYHKYGTDWHTDYIIESDEKLSINDIVEKCKASGVCRLEKTDNGYILRTAMY